jgi:hypothetical protein
MVFTYNFAPASNYFQTNEQIATSGLLLYINTKDSTSYNGSGSIVNDLSGNKNNMTISNATWDSINKVFNFNGSNSYIYSPNLWTQLTTGNSVYSQTQEVWYKSSSNGVLVNEANNLALNSWHDTQLEIVSGQVKGRYWNMPSPYLTLGTNSGSNWNYACIRYNGTTNKIDANFNGTFISQQNLIRLLSPTDPVEIYYILGIGDTGTNMGSGLYFNGQIAIYRTYKRALTDAEILTNYNSQKSLF